MAEHKDLYRYSYKDAPNSYERDLWRESHKANIACTQAIEEAISKGYHDNHLDDGIAKPIIERFGFNRVNWVLANTVKQNRNDVRISEENQKWAYRFRIPMNDNNWLFTVAAHPGLTNLFLNQVRKEWDQLGLYNADHCISEQDGQINYTGRIVVISPDIFKDECKKPEEQLFYVTGGNGARPNSMGRKVYGYFVSDNEQGIYYRDEIIGVLKGEHLPQWAKDRVYAPLRCVIAAPNEPAAVASVSAVPEDIMQVIGTEKLACNGHIADDGMFNIYYDPLAEMNGKPFNRQYDEVNYYGAILINGMNEKDIALTDEQAGQLVKELNAPQINEEQTEGVGMGGIT